MRSFILRHLSRLTGTALLAASVALGACADELVAPAPPGIRGLEVFPNPAAVRVGEDLLMVAKVAADSGANMKLIWTSSDPRRVEVSESGIVTGVAVGPAVITVVSELDPRISVVVPVSVGPRYTGIRSITASPVSLSLVPGQAQGVAVTVTADPDVNRAVTFKSDNPTVATVSALGVVTAASVGNATISVRSVVDSSVSVSVPVTVRAPTAARISIQSITSLGTNSPVDLARVVGQVDVLVNIEPGERTLSRIDLVINNNGRDTVVASQSFAAALRATQLRAAQQSAAQSGVAPRGQPTSTSAAMESATAVNPTTAASQAVIVQSFRTDAFNATTGAVAFLNLPTTIRAVAVEAGASGAVQQTASSSVTAQLANPDGFVVAVRPLASTLISTALDASGRRWMQAARGLELTSTPVLFSGRQLGSRVFSYPGDAPVSAMTSSKPGVAVDTLRLPANYSSIASGSAYVNGQLPSVLASDVSGNPIPLVPSLASGEAGGILNAQPTFVGGARLEGIRVDNAPPPAPTLSISSAQHNSNNWVNGDYQFASGLSNLTQDPGVGLRGSPSNLTVATTGLIFLVGSPNQADTAQVTGTDQLFASNTNAEYAVVAELSDRLGNTRRVGLTPTSDHPGSRFGVDKLPPTIRYTQGSLTGKTLVSTNSDSVFTSAVGGVGPRAFAVDVIDDRSGLPNGRVAIKLTRFAPPNPQGALTGTTSCIIGTGSSCTPQLLPFESVLPDNFRQVTTLIDGGTGLEGYFTFTATAQDQAGNVSVARSKRALIDAGTGTSAPVITGLGASGLLVGGDSARFLALASDNVELAQGGIMIAYPNLPGVSRMLAYATPLLGGKAIGTKFDTLLHASVAGAHPAFTIPNFIRGIEVVDSTDAPKAYTASTAKPNAANAWVSDFAFGGAPVSLAADVPILAGSVQSPSAVPGFLAGQGTERELTRWRRVANLPGLQFEAVGPSGQTVSPFARVLLVRQQATGLTVNPTVWMVIGELTTPLGTDNGLVRTWTYSFGALASGQYIAIGVSASGDAIATSVVTF